ncbi:hypothetical protein FisN_9Lh121 [Fistulifera solaris]|uniref:Uncharacterized protein n=1 Tax=Fistulifera solaris TaxID=1519565 RepID=A0A1Z5KKK2_FISSO|nr:hypothetical protein FisN_9Lh121 [Fistulifera solaris]|eukprot:GAX26844.1 hypothetical protein FisN_9Lh121 [Fistulifera solaris]
MAMLHKHVAIREPRTRRPAFEQLIIGPCMVFGEMVTGGHYLDVLQLKKQLVTDSSYWNVHRKLMQEAGGYAHRAFFRGFMPWGLCQCTKGVPVLFVQHESMQVFQQMGVAQDAAEKASGFVGGLSQAFFITPFQKMKLFAVARQDMVQMTPSQALQIVVRERGVLALYDGIVPTMVRRSLDWGVRFGLSTEAKNWRIHQKRISGDTSELNTAELVVCGLIGGAVGSLTHPIDNIITHSQKPLHEGAARDFFSVAARMYREHGVRAFTRGWALRVIDNSYHMAWMFGVSNVLYRWMQPSV